MSWLTKEEIDCWNAGRFSHSYERLGAHPDENGAWFAVWAPHAEYVAVVGDFNDWNSQANGLSRNDAGIWEGYVEGARQWHHYKYHIRRGDYVTDKADPYARALEQPSSGGSAVHGLSSLVVDFTHKWEDDEWIQKRKGPDSLKGAVAIYELHLGSWRHKVHGVSYGYRDIAEPLADHVLKYGFTHIELMPIMEHPFYGSWGYQVVGYYAPSFRYGRPDDLMYFVDYMHRRGIGVIMDWVPAHFATDPQGLVFFDGSTLFEYDDPRLRYHPDWGTYVFDYVKPGVKNFLVSNALYWIKEFHLDGLRFDAVASMLYRDYSRSEWVPNMFGGRENLEAIDLLKQVNETVYGEVPDVLMVAEESTAWPGVSQPTYNGGLGFLYKWNMGWMHDTLEFMTKDPVHRKYHHGNLTFPLVYAFSEHYVLPLSHDEVVHGKGSLWSKMPGDDWQKAANLRALFGHMFGSPGKKLVFMGGEFGQEREWNHDMSLDWHLLDSPLHAGISRWMQDLVSLYKSHPALWNDHYDGFEWIDFGDWEQSVLAYRRHCDEEELIFVVNLTPMPRNNYRIGVPEEVLWEEVLNSDAEYYGGSGQGNFGGVEAVPVPYHGRTASIVLTLPPLSVLVLQRHRATDG